MKVVQQRSSDKILKTPFANLSNFLGDPRAQHLEVYLAHVDLRRELWREFHLGKELLLLRLEAPILIHAHPSEPVSHLAASKHASCQKTSRICHKIVPRTPTPSALSADPSYQLQHYCAVLLHFYYQCSGLALELCQVQRTLTKQASTHAGFCRQMAAPT